MIIDRIENAMRYAGVHPGFREALEYIVKAHAKPPEPGRYAITGDRVYALVSQSNGHGPQEARLEAHRRFIDIQFTVRGIELYGWKSLGACNRESGPFNTADDVGFFADRPETWLPAPPGTFAVFFPEDAHAPLCGEGRIVKVVVKVAV